MDDLLRDLSRVVLAERPLTDVLTEITRIARRGIPGAEATSITLVTGDRGTTAAYDGEMALASEELQYAEDSGPCLDAGRGGVVLRIDDVRTEQRWPSYIERVQQTTEVRSSLSVPLPYQGAVIGALDVYSTRPRAFTSPESLRAGTDVAEAIAVAVANASAHHQLGEQSRNLRIAMQSRAVIEQAKGVLMAQQHVTEEQAFEFLRSASQRANRKLREVAAGVVASTQPAGS
ncbi:ANTAR domain-containing protein [Blastococcus sp. SYSU D00820]